MGTVDHSSREVRKVDTSAGPAFNPSLGAILDDKWQKKRLRELAKAAPSIFVGLSEKEGKLLAEALLVRTIEDLATDRFILLAQVIAHLARCERAQPSLGQEVRRAA